MLSFNWVIQLAWSVTLSLNRILVGHRNLTVRSDYLPWVMSTKIPLNCLDLSYQLVSSFADLFNSLQLICSYHWFSENIFAKIQILTTEFWKTVFMILIKILNKFVRTTGRGLCIGWALPVLPHQIFPVSL